MNPLIALWHTSIWIFTATVFIVALPFTLIWIGIPAALIWTARLLRIRRDAKYSWSANPQNKARLRRSGYRRARYGYFG